MSGELRGNVVAFAMTAGRLRRRAGEYRRKGQHVEAVELLYQALEREDAMATRLELADALMALACYEQAASLLYRTLSRRDAPAQAWLMLSRCQLMLGETEMAEDSLTHCLTIDPYGPCAEEAHALLHSGRAAAYPPEHARLGGLMLRASAAYRAGDGALAEKRLCRALRMAWDRVPVLCHWAEELLANGKHEAAAKGFVRALRIRAQEPRALAGLAVCLHGMGSTRMCRLVLDRAARACAAPEYETVFLDAAEQCGENALMERYLTAQLNKTPGRISLMYFMAQLQLERGNLPYATALWQRILRIDPGDDQARYCLSHAQEEPEAVLRMNEQYPIGDLFNRLACALPKEGEDAASAWLTPGSQLRMLADWVFTVPQREMQVFVLRLLAAGCGRAAEGYLRELLMLPTVDPMTRRVALACLYVMGASGSALLLTDDGMAVRKTVIRESGRHERWRELLRALLMATGSLRQSQPLAQYAAGLWSGMTRDMRQRVTSGRMLDFIRAIELKYLYVTGQRELAAWRMRHLSLSVRRVRRALRLITDGELDIREGAVCAAAIAPARRSARRRMKR